MLFYIPVILLVVAAAIAMLLVKELESLPILERKRRARIDAAHKHLYALRAHGLEAYLLLWGVMVACLSLAAGMILFRFTQGVASVMVLALLAFHFGWLLFARFRLPLAVASRVSVVAERLASWCSPVLRQVSRILRPMVASANERHGIYETDDLLAMLKTLAQDPDVRIPAPDLQMAENSLTYGSKLIRYYMTPRRMVKMVSKDEEVGPIMLDELHKSGFSRLPVYDGTEDNIVGTLHLKDLLDHKEVKTVAQVMRRPAYYVHEDLSLAHALKAFIKTKHHMFMVVNQFQEMVGLITIEDVLEQIIGQNIIDEFDQYDDLRAVAALHAKQDRQQKSENMV